MFQRFFLVLSIIFISLGLAQSTFDESRALLEDEQNTIDIISTYGNSVVSIDVSATRQSRNTPNGFDQGFPEEFFPPEFRDFFRFQMPEQTQPRRREGTGSGFVIGTDGSIITNYHVVQAALERNETALTEGSEITATFPNYDDAIQLEVVGVNDSYDLALLRPINDLPSELSNITAIPIADSDTIQVGQKTIAIGNPFGLASTVTTGIVSAISRDTRELRLPIPMVQTDAAINPGNSGGPLLNSRGELIGINTAIFSSAGMMGAAGNIGIGFAVPSNFLRDNLADLQDGGFSNIYSSRPRIGISIEDVRNYPRDIRESLDLPDEGVAIISVDPEGPAATAGLRGSRFNLNINGTAVPAPGDVIIAIDNESIDSSRQLQNIIFAHQPGDTVSVTIIRNGNEQIFDVILEIVPLEETE